MARTLYLTQNENLKAEVDGPSILINLEKKSPQRVPIRLINRVVIIGNLQIETALLSLFAEHNIPILTMDLAGKGKAITIPCGHGYQRNFRLQKIFLTSGKHREKFINWAKTKRMNLQIKLLQRLMARQARLYSREIGEGDYQFALKKFFPPEREKWSLAKNFVRSLFENVVTKQLIDAGLDPNIGVIHKRESLSLVLDLIFIIEPQIDEQVIAFFRSCRSQHSFVKYIEGWKLEKESLRDIIHRFENKKKENQDLVENVIDELFYLMRGDAL